ncbi:Zinc finger protein 236 [Plakobranchus ocellatus]|uniref:Zinc finger protein 236 n=1 Tax=Plakobranchus ocellatus TaxID=259542 RepID=A0AAV4CTU3_9GAST|nr:Zinc finger protein 236 [Plakobranchus ocellatus]
MCKQSNQSATTSKRKSAEGQQSEASTSHDGAADANVEMTNGSPVVDCFKGQETYHYQLTTKLFSLDRSCWNEIESVMEKVIKDDNAEHRISPEEKQRTLEAVQQYMKSANFYKQQTAQRTQEPLTPDEQLTLDAMSKDEWKKLDAAQDEATKYQLQERAKLLLRDFESHPRKEKPKQCRHCNNSYTASTSLHTHLMSISGIRYWVCLKCSGEEEITFTRRNSLLYHILMDNDIARYICPVPGCEKKHIHTHHQRSHARQHAEEELFQCNTEDSQNRNTEMLRNKKLKETDSTETTPKVEDLCLKTRERSKVLTCLMANNEVQDGPKRQETPGSTENGLTLLCAVALGNHPDEKENGPMEEHKPTAVKSEDNQKDVDVKKEL